MTIADRCTHRRYLALYRVHYFLNREVALRRLSVLPELTGVRLLVSGHAVARFLSSGRERRHGQWQTLMTNDSSRSQQGQARDTNMYKS